MSKKWEDWMTFGEGYRPPYEILDAVKEGILMDISYGNDVCPSFAFGLKDEHGIHDFVLWVDHWIQSEREFPEHKRFMMVKNSGEEIADIVLETDDVTEALAKVRELLKEEL